MGALEPSSSYCWIKFPIFELVAEIGTHTVGEENSSFGAYANHMSHPRSERLIVRPLSFRTTLLWFMQNMEMCTVPRRVANGNSPGPGSLMQSWQRPTMRGASVIAWVTVARLVGFSQTNRRKVLLLPLPEGIVLSSPNIGTRWLQGAPWGGGHVWMTVTGAAPSAIGATCSNRNVLADCFPPSSSSRLITFTLGRAGQRLFVHSLYANATCLLGPLWPPRLGSSRLQLADQTSRAVPSHPL